MGYRCEYLGLAFLGVYRGTYEDQLSRASVQGLRLAQHIFKLFAAKCSGFLFPANSVVLRNVPNFGDSQSRETAVSPDADAHNESFKLVIRSSGKVRCKEG